MSHFNELIKPFKYLITKGNLTENKFQKESAKTLQILESATKSNISLVQIREKKLSAKLVFQLASESLKLTKDTNTKILINERIDIAIAAKADGVHLTSNSIPIDKIRQIAPTNFIVGVSTHSFEEAKLAKDCGADFVTYSPIFPTTSKVNYGESKGLDGLKNVCNKLKPFPVLALGGINKKNYKSVLESGASGFAAISFLNDREHIEGLSYE